MTNSNVLSGIIHFMPQKVLAGLRLKWKSNLWQQDAETENIAIEKIRRGMEFGLFGEEANCYFEDGKKVTYEMLWEAIRFVYTLDIDHHKTLYDVCTYSFIGKTKRRYSKRQWKKLFSQTYI
jgi:hypothetical protein